MILVLARIGIGAALICTIFIGACTQTSDSVEVLSPEEVAAFLDEDPVFRAVAEAAHAPHVYMAIQNDAAGPVSVIFAIDRSRDRTPSDEPAIRLTPDNGKCNVQFMRYYNFPSNFATRPIYSQNEALLQGVAGHEVANLMAMEVTSEMMRQGLVSRPQDSKPQNVCTRKLWEQLITSKSFRT